MKNSLMNLRHDDYMAEIRSTEDGFELWWTDYVANEWSEIYRTLAQAIARLALLQHCCETWWEARFVASPERFADDFDVFVAETGAA